MVLFDRNHAICHRNLSSEIIVCIRRGTPSEISSEGLPVTQNPTISLSAFSLGLRAGTLRGTVPNLNQCILPETGNEDEERYPEILHQNINEILDQWKTDRNYLVP